MTKLLPAPWVGTLGGSQALPTLDVTVAQI
jgi:hypothetical protein